MTPDIAICLAILAAAVAMFAWDRVPADVVAIGVMLALILTGLLPADKAFAGFGSDTVMMILGLLIMSAGLIQTGVVDIAGRSLFEVAGKRPEVFLPVTMVSIAVVSAFMSNTAATAVFVPLVIGYAARINSSPSKFLLPIAFSSILTSSVTIISTSTNLIVSDVLTRYQQPPMGMFELSPVGVPIAVAGLLYVWLIGTRLLPERSDQKSEEKVGERHYQADFVVGEKSPLIGKTLDEAKIDDSAGLTVVKVVRGQKAFAAALGLSDLKLQAGDDLFIEGLRADLLKARNIDGLDFKADVEMGDVAQATSHEDKSDDKKDEKKDDASIVEGVLLPNSPLIGESLKTLEFKERYGLQVLALHRARRAPRSISTTPLRMGDVLLLQGSNDALKALERGNLFNIFGGIESGRLDIGRAPLAAAIFAVAVITATLKLTSLPVAMLVGAFLMLVTRCITPEEAYRQIEWKALILIGALLALGVAMETSGAGKYIALQLIELVGAESKYALLTCFFVLTVALTQPMSNQAAALVVLPIAMQTGIEVGGEPRAFAMMVAVAASCSYLTPLEPSCLMVYGPGKYRFSDFVKVGAPLTVLIYVIAILLVPVIWPV